MRIRTIMRLMAVAVGGLVLLGILWGPGCTARRPIAGTGDETARDRIDTAEIRKGVEAVGVKLADLIERFQLVMAAISQIQSQTSSPSAVANGDGDATSYSVPVTIAGPGLGVCLLAAAGLALAERRSRRALDAVILGVQGFAPVKGHPVKGHITAAAQRLGIEPYLRRRVHRQTGPSEPG